MLKITTMKEHDKITNISTNKTMLCGKKIIDLSTPLVMGIVNLTDDSFYDGGRYNSLETTHMKKFLTENLKHIIEETSTAVYRDRRGNKLSPAALRSVAVAASKTLMDMYPVKEAQVSKLNIEGGGENGIVFNVIVPESKPKENETD